jgi:hypothetical protein
MLNILELYGPLQVGTVIAFTLLDIVFPPHGIGAEIAQSV